MTEVTAIRQINDATFVASNNSIKGLLGTGDDIVAAMPQDQVALIQALSNEELFPRGEKALKDITDDIIVLNEIRNRFRAANGAAIMGYQNWREFIERNSRYSVRTAQRRLSQVNGKDESKVNDRYATNAELVQEERPVANGEVAYQIDHSAPILPAVPIEEPTVEVLASGHFWEALYYKLNALAPSVSDGAEHILVEMLRESATKTATSQAEKNFRKYVIVLLNKISEDFAMYASKLNAEVV